jgi:large subunit ribosomal protein L16
VAKPPLHFGDYGIYACESIRLKAAQIEAARMAILKTVGRKGLKIWIRTFPHIPVTKKPLEVRMGKGKGSVDHFIANVKAGKMIFEFTSPSASTAKLAFIQARYKLPIKVKFVQRELTNAHV